MSEPDPPSSGLSQNSYTILFMVVLSLICAIILSVLASALKEPQELAKELDRSKQMLIAARILSPVWIFSSPGRQGEFCPCQTKGRRNPGAIGKTSFCESRGSFRGLPDKNPPHAGE